ncbi:hypothetical protein, partial [Psychrobacillus vulpis]|uniref:hypothetical protein n=1 Tax=Psychrobacillus vulpis TaxID=2325572 RepID=UPI00197F1B53
DLRQYLGHKKVKSVSERHPFMKRPASSETSQVKNVLDSFRWIQEIQAMDVVPKKCAGRVHQEAKLPIISDCFFPA